MERTVFLAPVELTVAADPAMLLIVRLTTAGVVARAGLTLDAMDNLKFAAEEAFTCLIGQDAPPSRVELRFDCARDELAMTLRAKDLPDGRGMEDAELDVVRCILESLADRVTLDAAEGRIRAIEFRVRLS